MYRNVLGRDIHKYVYYKMIFWGFFGIREIFSILGPIVIEKYYYKRES